jgi:N-acetylglucosaminyldiphosphoundecaprenol N-acetyl-beta-D-mannosaminyltransferase
MAVNVRKTAAVLGVPIDALEWDQAIARIQGWASNRESRYVCICNVHSVVTAAQDDGFRAVICQSDMATPDGAPVSWLLRRSGFPQQQRINGPDLMWKYCEQATYSGESVYFYGGTNETLVALQANLRRAFPTLKIAGTYAPPFRTLTAEEDSEAVARINSSGAGVVWISLGCPKQENWMADHKGRVNAVMIGVGAAFDYHAGTVTRAPLWMQRNGLEWLYRLFSEPRRLWKRYLVTNTMFLVLAARQLLFANEK